MEPPYISYERFSLPLFSMSNQRQKESMVEATSFTYKVSLKEAVF